MTIQEALKKYSQELKGVSQTPLLDTEVLLMNILKKEKVFLYSHPEKQLKQGTIEKLSSNIRKRKKYFPVAYLTGEKEFFGNTFKVNEGVLIPRQETELLVEEGIKEVRRRKNSRIIEIGVGSGCVLISIALNCSQKKIKEAIGVDISEKALKVARQNKKKLKAKIKIRKSNGFKQIGRNKKFDLIISNPPYLSLKEYNNSPTPEIKKEPKNALTEGKNGLNVIKFLLREAKNKLNPGGMIIMEIGKDQKAKIKKLLGDDYKIEVKKDLAGRERVLKISK